MRVLQENSWEVCGFNFIFLALFDGPSSKWFTLCFFWPHVPDFLGLLSGSVNVVPGQIFPKGRMGSWLHRGTQQGRLPLHQQSKGRNVCPRCLRLTPPHPQEGRWSWGWAVSWGSPRQDFWQQLSGLLGSFLLRLHEAFSGFSSSPSCLALAHLCFQGLHLWALLRVCRHNLRWRLLGTSL